MCIEYTLYIKQFVATRNRVILWLEEKSVSSYCDITTQCTPASYAIELMQVIARLLDVAVECSEMYNVEHTSTS